MLKILIKLKSVANGSISNFNLQDRIYKLKLWNIEHC